MAKKGKKSKQRKKLARKLAKKVIKKTKKEAKKEEMMSPFFGFVHVLNELRKSAKDRGSGAFAQAGRLTEILGRPAESFGCRATQR